VVHWHGFGGKTAEIDDPYPLSLWTPARTLAAPSKRMCHNLL
jgi:hypothetical protein